MTAYLQPGDKIHLAFGIDSNLTYPEKVKQAESNARTLIAQYADLGVEVVLWSANNVLAHPVVVSVIRPGYPMAIPETLEPGH